MKDQCLGSKLALKCKIGFRSS